MNSKSILEYVVPPLERFWSLANDFKGGGTSFEDKNKFIWTMMIRQPEFVTSEIFEMAKFTLAKKKMNLDTSKTKLVSGPVFKLCT